jgi:hypothetical protein
MLHPDWDEQQIKDEIALINAQKPQALPDPMFMHPNDGMTADGGTANPAADGVPAGNG